LLRPALSQTSASTAATHMLTDGFSTALLVVLSRLGHGSALCAVLFSLLTPVVLAARLPRMLSVLLIRFTLFLRRFARHGFLLF
jgi:hypothetical protein